MAACMLVHCCSVILKGGRKEEVEDVHMVSIEEMRDAQIRLRCRRTVAKAPIRFGSGLGFICMTLPGNRRVKEFFLFRV